MKKLLSLIIVFVTVISLGVLFNSCESSENSVREELPISFGEKYTYMSEKTFDDGHYVKRIDSYIFYKNGKGEFHHYLRAENMKYNDDYTESATIKFRWDMSSYDGALFLFEEETIYHDDHTEGEEVTLTQAPFTVSQNVLFPATSSFIRYVREGSELFDLNNDIEE
ncbi:MAG: hypothetical protein IJ039_06635 [Clostridia bacterium]|nr:hypothetical protein [Clostridia bacterium]